MDNIVTRFAPSPTGSLHVGGARTALFNWLYARHYGGKFILRIEDTDLIRSSNKSIETILEALKWLEIDWDAGPYFQTDRFDIYRYYLKKLIESGQAYYCNCSEKYVEVMREKAISKGCKPKYDGTCRNRELKPEKRSVIRFKAPFTGVTVLNDVIKGKISFNNIEENDFIICRSDGSPTYNFVVVIDDISMKVTTIIRGDDHVMNTPKQIMLYNALKESLPIFGHVPMVLSRDKTRLSKRHGATSIIKYRDYGYLPDAFINYIVRLGWSHGNDEFFTRDDLIKKFNLTNIGKSASVFDSEKLKSLNFKHIMHSSETNLIKHLNPFLIERNYNTKDIHHLKSVIRTLKKRSKTLTDMADSAYFYYKEISPPYDEKVSSNLLKPQIKEVLSLLSAQFQILENFNEECQEVAFKEVMNKTGLGFGKIAQAVRIVLTGSTISPGIFEMIEVLGKDIVIERLNMGINFIESKCINRS